MLSRGEVQLITLLKSVSMADSKPRQSKAFGEEFETKKEEQKRCRKQEKEKKEEKAKKGRKRSDGWWGDGVVGAGTGNVLRKYFQSFVICFLYKAYGLH